MVVPSYSALWPDLWEHNRNLQLGQQILWSGKVGSALSWAQGSLTLWLLWSNSRTKGPFCRLRSRQTQEAELCQQQGAPWAPDHLPRFSCISRDASNTADLPSSKDVWIKNPVSPHLKATVLSCQSSLRLHNVCLVHCHLTRVGEASRTEANGVDISQGWLLPALRFRGFSVGENVPGPSPW